jgi:RNA polymerase sigma-70 factor, ECF subfamily
MTKINLREYYPFQKYDNVIEVADEVAEAICESERTEAAYQRRIYRHKAYYSLDRDDGTEYDAVFVSLSPCELYERKITYEQLHAAITQLPDIQAKRIYAHYFMGMSQVSIARAEGVSRKAICVSIAHGLQNLERILKNLFI